MQPPRELSGRQLSRRDFLHGMLHPFATTGTSGARPEDAEPYSAEPDYLALLPPEFSEDALKMEVVRLGEDPDRMTRNDMAALVVRAMYGAVPPTAPGQTSRDPVREEKRASAD